MGVVLDCRGQEIRLGSHVVAAGNEGRLYEGEVRALETGEPGGVKMYPDGYPPSGAMWLPSDHVAVVLPPFVIGDVPADASLLVFRIQGHRLTAERAHELSKMLKEHVPGALNRTVILDEDLWPIEWWTDERLEQIGLQRIPQDGS